MTLPAEGGGSQASYARDRKRHTLGDRGHWKGDNVHDYRRTGVPTEPSTRPHRVNVRIDATLHARLRRESEESGRSLSAVMRLALARGVEVVAGERGGK